MGRGRGQGLVGEGEDGQNLKLNCCSILFTEEGKSFKFTDIIGVVVPPFRYLSLSPHRDPIVN